MKSLVNLFTKKVSFLLIMLLLTAVIVASVHTLTAKPQASFVPAAPNSPWNSFLSQRNVIAGESITLTPRGFEPTEISRPQGRFVLNINNRSGLHEVTFLLTHETGNRLREVQFPKGKLSSRELLDLPPGRYLLTEANHPRWVCQIEITAR